MEIWKDIKDYEDLYQVSNLGRVRTKKTSLIKKSFLHNGKYHRVQLRKNGVKKNLRVHRIVAEAFKANPDNLPEVNHLDLNPSNNHIDNLEWISGEDNINHYLNSDKYKKFNKSKV